MRRTIGIAGALTLLAACGGDGGEGAGGVTAEESRQLNEAATMLDAAPDTVIPADETGLANEGSAESGDVLVADTNSNTNSR
jgi:hypothetical protein